MYCGIINGYVVGYLMSMVVFNYEECRIVRSIWQELIIVNQNVVVVIGVIKIFGNFGGQDEILIQMGDVIVNILIFIFIVGVWKGMEIVGLMVVVVGIIVVVVGF